MGGEEEWEGGPQLECKMKFFKEKEKKGGEAQPQVRTCVVVQALISSMGAAEERPARSREARGYIATPYFKTQDKMKQNKNSRRAGLNVLKKVIERQVECNTTTPLYMECGGYLVCIKYAFR